MARTRADIQEGIQQVLVDELAAIGVAINPATWSKTNLLRLLCFVFSFSAYFLETLFDLFRTDVETALLARTPHTLTWYAVKLKEYMHGVALPDDSDRYDTTGLTEEQVMEAKVVRQSAVTEHANQNGTIYLRMKTATEVEADLAPLTSEQLNGLREYVNRIKDAGIKVEVESNEPDRIKMLWKIYYDPLVLDANGNRLDGSEQDVVRVSIKEYLKQISFNGVYAIQKHEDYVQQVEGVVLCPVQYAQSAFGAYDWATINELIVPDAGYMRFADDEDLQINYIAFKK